MSFIIFPSAKADGNVKPLVERSKQRIKYNSQIALTKSLFIFTIFYYLYQKQIYVTLRRYSRFCSSPR